MAECLFPILTEEVITTLVDVFQHQHKPLIHKLIESAKANFVQTDYDNWNGGTYTWTLRLAVPVSIFANVEGILAEVEKEIYTKLSYITRSHSNHIIGEVIIFPMPSAPPTLNKKIVPSEPEVQRLWPNGLFRLFLSHTSKHKEAIMQLKDALRLRGITAFVAHHDIEPSLEWQNELELALQSMHALAALVTQDFHTSCWTDQEIGWAFGRNRLVLPVFLDVKLYGFFGKYQGVRGRLDQPGELADSIIKILLANSQTHSLMRSSLIKAFAEADSFKMAITLRNWIVGIEDFADEEKATLRKACEENNQVSQAFGVPDAIYATFGRGFSSEEAEIEDVPF